uniref:Calreticulin/calnexin n=1 Tax=Tanacetum cinerariifolium TaxID=118510 RepID=A0A6L2JRJ6_TANCI|nr:calreticulin/calnexin [Tanacetum cinerariifolium]
MAYPFYLMRRIDCTIFGFPHYLFNYSRRRLTIEEILAKFIDEGKRKHEEMEISIKEFRTTNELLLKERNNFLIELKIEVNKLSKVMEESTVTYTIVSSPFGGLLDIGSQGVDGPPVMPEDLYAYVVATFQAPSSLGYVSGPEYPPSPEFIPEPVYPEFMPPEDKILSAKEQPLPTAVLPTTDLPGYVPESDPKEDLEEDDDEDPKEDPANYHVDGGDESDDKDESSDDDEDDDIDMDIDRDDEEEEDLASADSAAVAFPAVEHDPSAEETKPFETDESAATPPPHPAYRVTARISIRDETPVLLPLYTKIERLLDMPTPPSSPLSPPIRPFGYRTAMIWLRAGAASTTHCLPLPPPIILSHTRSDAPPSETPPLLPIPAPTSSPPLLLPSTNRREDRPEVTLQPRKRLGIALGPRYEVEESSSAAARLTGDLKADYGFVATLDREIRRDPEKEDTDEIYRRLDDEQSERQLMAGRINMLFRDRRAHARIARLIETKAMMSREAWGRSMDASNLARAEGPAKGPVHPDAPGKAGGSS